MVFWTIPYAEPVIYPGMLHPQFAQARAGAAHVIRLGDKYRMAYWGSAGGLNYILQAETAVDEPNGWTSVGTALIGPQGDTSYNCKGPGFPFLLPLTADHWLLYFTGWGRQVDGKLPNTTGVAVSNDAGQSWDYHWEHPVIPLDKSYDAEGTGSLWIVRENGLLRMYYTAIGKYGPRPEGVETGHGDTIPQIGIAYAESRDGLHWEKPVEKLLVAPRGFEVDPYEYICSKPCVIREENGYTMWVNTFGTAYRVHRLVSKDGLNWQWAERSGPDGELSTGNAGAFDDHQRSYPSIVSSNGEWHCWFTGNGFGTTGIGYAVFPSRERDEALPLASTS